VLARYGSLRNGRTYIALDFDTTPLPDNAVIDQVSLSLFVRNLDEEATDGAPPPPLNCGDIVPGAGNLNTLQVGIFWRGVPSLGCFCRGSPALGYAGPHPNVVVTEGCSPWTDMRGGVNNPSTASAGTWLVYPLFPTIYTTPPVTTTQVTRYGIDLELAPEGFLR